MFAGIALGTFVTVTAYINGYRPPAAGPAAVLAGFLTWVLLAALAVAVIEVLRRHHRAIGRRGWRYGKRCAVATASIARRHGRTAHAFLVAKAGPRWAGREHQPLMFRRLREPQPAGGSPAGTGQPPQQPSDEGKSMTLNLTGRHSGPGFPDHTFAECSPGLCGEQAGALARRYARPSKIAPERRAQRAARSGGTVPVRVGARHRPDRRLRDRKTTASCWSG